MNRIPTRQKRFKDWFTDWAGALFMLGMLCAAVAVFWFAGVHVFKENGPGGVAAMVVVICAGAEGLRRLTDW